MIQPDPSHTSTAHLDSTPSLEGPTAAQLKQKYATPPSRFIDMDGVAMHYRDEGSGPVVIMLPGHLGNLRMFDDWADYLRSDFRVVRLDWPPYGLSLPDNAPNAYGTARGTQLVAMFMEQMDIANAMVVGTSNGATVAAHLAAEHPEKVSRLALSTLPLGPPPPRELSAELQEQLALYRDKSVRPESFYRAVLEGIFADPANVTDEIVTMYTDMNNHPDSFGAIEEFVRSNREMYQTKSLTDLYSTIDVPVFIQWGDSGVVLPPEFAQQAVDAFPSAPVLLMRYPNSGHKPMLEEPALTGRDLKRFLNGELDDQLSQPAG